MEKNHWVFLFLELLTIGPHLISVHIRLGREGISFWAHYPGIQDHSRKQHSQVTCMVQHFIESDQFGVKFAAWTPPVCSLPFRPCVPPGVKHSPRQAQGEQSQAGFELVLVRKHPLLTTPRKHLQPPWLFQFHHLSTHTWQRGPAHRKHIQCWGGS